LVIWTRLVSYFQFVQQSRDSAILAGNLDDDGPQAVAMWGIRRNVTSGMAMESASHSVLHMDVI